MSILDFFLQRKANLDALADKRSKARKAKGRIRIKSRVSEVLDPKTASPLFTDIKSADPLEFSGYAEKTADLSRRSGLNDAFTCAVGTIKGHMVVCAELVPEFLMGSMGTAVGEAVCRSAEYARERNLPLVVFSASGGARMQEGMFSLMQMAKTSAAIRRLSDEGGLFISVLTHPTTGGVTASFAMLGDIILAEPNALIGFAGPRVIEQTIRSTLPEGFQSAEFQQAHGFVDKIVPREQMRDTLATLLDLHPYTRATVGSVVGTAKRGNNSDKQESSVGNGSKPFLHNTPPSVAAQSSAEQALYISHRSQNTTEVLFAQEAAAKTPAQHVEIARHPARPHAHAFIQGLFNDFVELHGDRQFRDDQAIVGGLASFEGLPVTVAAHLKGGDLNENIAYNFGMPHPEGYRKFIRLAKQAEKFGRPLITFIDTPGAYPGAEAEERGQGEAIARCLFELSGLAVPTIAIITGEGGSGGALALGLSDRVVMYEYAIYSVLSPEGFATILWKDAKRASEASEVMKLTARDLYGFNMIDAIVKEPAAGAQSDPEAAVEALRPILRDMLGEVCGKDTTTLLAERYDKYRKFS
jgi:acetyl-CoA carboxylase carboxyl transferase subunit beta